MRILGGHRLATASTAGGFCGLVDVLHLLAPVLIAYIRGPCATFVLLHSKADVEIGFCIDVPWDLSVA